MKNNTFEYGPIILDSRRGVYVYVKVNCPQNVADAVAEGDDNTIQNMGSQLSVNTS